MINENINLLKERIDFYNDLPPEKKNNFLNIIKNDYTIYDNLIGLFPKIKRKNIEKYVHLIESKLNKGNNRHEIKNYYTVHAGLIEFLLDNSDIESLKFNDNIKLYSVYLEDVCIAGVVMYISEKVAHAQYTSANEIGKKLHALDFLYDYLINEKFTKYSYFDFGGLPKTQTQASETTTTYEGGDSGGAGGGDG